MKSTIVLVSMFIASSLTWAKPVAYKIDPDHSSVVFKVNHLGFSDVYGMFEDVQGSLLIDDKNPKNSSITITIKTNSLDTNVEKRDKHLNSPDFFNSKQFPNITFKSESVKSTGKNKYQVTGTLDLHGVKKKITIPFERHRTGKDPWGNIRTGGSAKISLKRSDYGMTYMMGKDQVGDQVDILISAEAVQEKKSE